MPERKSRKEFAYMGSKREAWIDFPNRLRWVLDRDERSRGEIAAEADVNQSRLSEWSGGRKSPSLENVQALGRAMPQVNLRWLLVGEGEPFSAGEQAEWKLAAIRRVLDAQSTEELADLVDPRGAALHLPSGPTDEEEEDQA